MPSKDELELGAVIAASFYAMQAGEEPKTPIEPSAGDVQLAFDILRSTWLADRDSDLIDQSFNDGYESGRSN